MTDKLYDVAIVGAGLAGLTCAGRLQELGFGVVILEKSRGVGGRVATRRLSEGTWADHGLPYLAVRGTQSEQLLQTLIERKIAHLWQNSIGQLSSSGELQPYSTVPAYVSATGLTAIAKFLAQDLEIRHSCRVFNLTPTSSQTWQLNLATDASYPHRVEAKIVVLAIPAPQASILIQTSAIENLAPSFLSDLASVRFNSCLAVIAGYDAQRHSDFSQWQGLRIDSHPDLSWVSLESSKRTDTTAPIFVFHSSPSFAQTYLDTSDLELAGQQLLQSASQLLSFGFDSPSWFQVHRWRYSLPLHALSVPCLVTTDPLPIVCCGDWCGGNLIESALHSGFTAADRVIENLLL